MKKAYVVMHEYDLDGGYGDAICSNEIISIFKNKTQAEEFAKRYENDHVYDTGLCCGHLSVYALDLFEESEAVPEYEWVSGWLSPDSLMKKRADE